MEKVLKELVELNKASIRLQKFAISLQAETLSVLLFAQDGGKGNAVREKQVMKHIQQIRRTLDRVEAGKGLPK